ncbi:MAG: Hsp20/alpha crystallin family protein [Anaerolineaceae bacterium]|nr:Hsp20/alpha crystallin family protein [Anaerolineaceae bacterium]
MLSRWDPFREMVSMRRAVDRLIENSVGSEEWQQAAEWSLALDVVENEDAYLVKASVPGIKPDELEITFNKGILTIKGEVKDESETSKGEYHLRERRYGVFSRSISLPSTVKADDIQANYDNGVLTLKLPLAEEIKPRRIPIKAGEGMKVINAKNK